MSNKVTTVKQAIDGFLLSCKVEGKSYGTIECYSGKLKGFLWYAMNYGWPDDITQYYAVAMQDDLSVIVNTVSLASPVPCISSRLYKKEGEV